jgi:hypothetical protein
MSEAVREKVEQWVALGQLRLDVEAGSLMAMSLADDDSRELDATAVVDKAASLGIDRAAFGQRLEAYLTALASRDTPDAKPHDLIAARRREVEQELAGEPAGLQRAETLLAVLADTLELHDSDVEAYADPAVDLRNQQRKELRARWHKQWLEGREERRALRGEAFWVSADFRDHYDDVAYYRVYERYGFSELDELFDDVAKGIGERLIDGLTVADPFGRFSIPGTHALAAAEQLWLVSRSRRLRRELHAPAASAVAALLHGQSDDGTWPGPVAAEGGDHPPSAQATAMTVIAARRLSRDEGHAAQGERAISWLMRAQAPDGSWSGVNGEPDVVATALALQASRAAAAREPRRSASGPRIGSWRGNTPPACGPGSCRQCCSARRCSRPCAPARARVPRSRTIWRPASPS